MELHSVFYVGIIPALLSAFTWYKYRGLEYILIHYRWIFVILFLLPLSLAYDVFFYARNWLVFKLNSAPHKHEQKVKYVQQQVCRFISLLLFVVLFNNVINDVLF